jgi:hypothetical protein
LLIFGSRFRVQIARPGSQTLGYERAQRILAGRAWAGAAVVAASLRVLDTVVFAGVTDGNTPSEGLLGSLGFVRIGPA